MTPTSQHPSVTPNESPSGSPQPANPQPNPGTPPASTQGNMGDGAGQRGGYGDSDQTNGMEGGDSSSADAASQD